MLKQVAIAAMTLFVGQSVYAGRIAIAAPASPACIQSIRIQLDKQNCPLEGPTLMRNPFASATVSCTLDLHSIGISGIIVSTHFVSSGKSVEIEFLKRPSPTSVQLVIGSSGEMAQPFKKSELEAIFNGGSIEIDLAYIGQAINEK